MRALILKGLCCASLLAVCVGCSGDAVQEDRQILFSGDGNTSFQHGSDGVFINVAGEPRSIFTPAEDVLATSTPQWSSDKRYVLFTTAVPLAHGASGQPSDWNATPDGRRYLKKAVTYTCWLYDTQTVDTQPKELFQAQCRHTGYVAANLAVRWTKDDRGVLFVSANANAKHSLRLYDLSTKASQSAFPHSVDWLVFDTISDSNQLAVCVEDMTHTGVWIGDGGEWWHVSQARGSNQLRTNGSLLNGLLPIFPSMHDSPIERLRGLKPVWLSDGNRFAFVSREPAKAESDRDTYRVHVGHRDRKTAKVIHETTNRLSDLHWQPDGSRLGLVDHSRNGAQVVSLTMAGTSEPLTQNGVNQFAGWNQSGDSMAVVVPEDPSVHTEKTWAFVVFPSLPGRESLQIVGQNAPLFSGTRVTFPNWSPDGQKLSFWATFTPKYRVLPLMLAGLQTNGDPAVTVDLNTGELHWMPVTAMEELFVGHYYLQQNQPATAIDWYDKVTKRLPDVSETGETQRLLEPLFRFICLRRLGRDPESQVAWARFRSFVLQEMQRRESTGDIPLPEEQKAQVHETATVCTWLWALEACLAVADVNETSQLMSAIPADSPLDALLRSICLGQTELLRQDRVAYLNRVHDETLPLAITVLGADVKSVGRVSMSRPLLTTAQLAIMPLLTTAFYEDLPDEQLATSSESLVALKLKYPNSSASAVIDRVLVSIEIARGTSIESKLDQRRLDSANRMELNEEDLASVTRLLRQFPASLNNGNWPPPATEAGSAD